MLFHKVQHKLLTDKLSQLKIRAFADTHAGDPNFYEKLLMEEIREVKESNSLAILAGDLINNGIKCSIGNCYEDIMKPREQVKYITELFKPIKDKIIGVIEGNHERRTTKEVDQSPAERYAEMLGVQFFGDEVLLKIPFGKCAAEGNTIVNTVYATHGYGGGRKPGAKVNNLSNMGDIVIADLYISAHTHLINTHSEVIYIPDTREEKVREHLMTFVTTGSYLKRGGYAIQKGYAPVKLGSPTITLGGKRKEISVTI
jgi:hypothetical protein